MNFDEYQMETSKTAVYPKDDALAYLTLGLNGEAGEVAEEVKKSIRSGHWNEDTEDRILKELGDTIWYAAQLCEVLGFSFQEVAETNLQKLRKRYG